MLTGRLISVLLLGASCAAAANDDQCVDMLRKALAAHNPETRKQAVVALSLASERSPRIPLLEGMLDDKDVEVRIAVVTSLSEVQSRGATDALRKVLQDEVPEVSFAAAKALWSRHDPEGR